MKPPFEFLQCPHLIFYQFARMLIFSTIKTVLFCFFIFLISFRQLNEKTFFLNSGDWNSMGDYLSFIPSNTYENFFFRAVYSVHNANYSQACQVIDHVPFKNI